MNKIRVIIKRPDEEIGHVTNISNSLGNLQKTVEGRIEVFTLVKDYALIICNEEGKINDLPYNCTICGEQFFGTIIAVGVDDEEFADLPKEITLKFWKEKVLRK